MNFFEKVRAALDTIQIGILPEDQHYKKAVLIIIGGFLFFRFLRFAYKRFVKNLKVRTILKKTASTAEVIFWVLFCIWAIFNFVVEGDSKKETGNLVFLGLMLIVIALFSWFVLRDFIAGLILRLEGIFETGDRVRANNIEGIVKKLGYRAILLETEEGEWVTVPYSKLTGEINAKLQRNGSNISKKLRLELLKEKTWEQTHQELKKLLLNAPWSLMNQQVAIKLVGEQNDSYLVDCIVHVLDHEHLPKLKDYLDRQQSISLHPVRNK